MTRGKYIVIEGAEGVGKTTQIEELARRLRAAGLPVRTLREPDSQSDLTARAIRQLTQDPHYPMNTRTEVLLYNAARSQSLQVIKNSVEHGVICLVDRNYLTTLAIQYYGRGDVPDYDTINGIIRFAVAGVEPDLCIVLDAPVAVLRERLGSRRSGERFDNLDSAFLERVRAGYLWEAKQRNMPVVFATQDESTLADEIWQLVTRELSIRKESKASLAAPPASVKEVIKDKALPARSKLPARSNTPESLSDEEENLPLIEKDENGVFHVTEAGKKYLDGAVTNPEGNVYAFTEKLSAVTIAAAMARLSRRGDDMRITILDEFANKVDKDEKLLQRVITAYGDDSVQQLAGLHIVVENASNLLTKKLEWGRLASYLEQSTRYIYFDQKDKDGKYRYFVPEYLESGVKEQYCAIMDEIFTIYSKMVREVTKYVREHSSVPEAEQDGAWKGATRAQACDAARPVLPVATKSTVGIYASGQAIESIIMHLLTDDLPEADAVGRQILVEARKVLKSFLERVDVDDRGIAAMGYRAFTKENFKEVTKSKLKKTVSEDYDEPVKLVDYWPKNEMLLLKEMIYETSHLSLDEIEDEVNSWPYQDKLDVFNAYMGERFNRRHRPGRALEKAHYSWDIICDYGIFRDLHRHRMVDDMAWQQLTPRYGYEVPELIEEAGQTDNFERCFELSLKLYSLLQEHNYPNEAQYATLLGHKMRWKVTYNAREAFHLHELRTSPQGHPGYRKLVMQMHQKLAEVHPLLAEAMKFVNTAEDPELTRLAAERYTQTKLEKLDKKQKPSKKT
ncbi:MAG TPA: dTMP kinase [Candidatus Saccharimonadales bacterium]|nr:dTMP kinase [Candidatus Saccharimonadales bacterium]